MAASDLERLRIKVGWGLRNPGFTWVERLELLETTSKFRTSHEISSSSVHFLHKTWQKENERLFCERKVGKEMYHKAWFFRGAPSSPKIPGWEARFSTNWSWFLNWSPRDSPSSALSWVPFPRALFIQDKVLNTCRDQEVSFDCFSVNLNVCTLRTTGGILSQKRYMTLL